MRELRDDFWPPFEVLAKHSVGCSQPQIDFRSLLEPGWPVRDQVKRKMGLVDHRRDNQEARAVRKRVVIRQDRRRICHQTGSPGSENSGRLHACGEDVSFRIQKEELLPILPPFGRRSSLGRDLPLAASRGEALDVDLFTTGFRGGVRRVFPIGREAGIRLVRCRSQIREWLAGRRDREDPDVIIGSLSPAPNAVEDEAPVRRPAARRRYARRLAQQLLRPTPDEAFSKSPTFERVAA